MKIQLTYDRAAHVQTDLLVIILDNTLTFHDLGGAPIAETVNRIKKDFANKRLKSEYFTSLETRASKTGARNLLVLSTSLSPSFNVWENVKIAVARSLRVARDHSLGTVAIALNTNDAAPFIGKAVEGALLGAYAFDKYRSEKSTLGKINVELIGLAAHDQRNRRSVAQYTIVSNAANEARDLINEPGSVVYPEVMAAAARRIAKESDLDIKIWDEKKLAKDGFNGLIQVGRGSSRPPRLIRLTYRAKKAKRRLALVGKGVTFDTGGISIKPADKMWEMKGDMSGGAAVLLAMKAIGKLRPSVDVIGIVPTAENTPDANAQLPGDVFIARNKKSVMVDNTDAEGRLILTDGLFQAGEEGATHIVDIATLTGACVRALGPSIAGAMGNNRDLIQAVIRSGRNHGEEYWELPLHAEYKEMIKAPCADVNNTGGPLAGAITAGLFLQEFVPDGAAWAHLDIAGPFIREKDWKYYEAGAIGFGLKTLVDLAQRFDEYVP
ncbi:MAG TPA: leucyl aminopeptidase [Terriglobia bacterium]|nr:leucyl aminopeptidase [Terriglobia bacterium]